MQFLSITCMRFWKVLLSHYFPSAWIQSTALTAFTLELLPTTEEINKRLNRIKPPEEFRRTPRSITTFKHWKASEFRAWLLYYSLPVLSDLMPGDYIHHLSLLVSAIHILLASDVDFAHSLLVAFYNLLPQLYPSKICTMNMHSLVHLSKFVHCWRPLWCYSCFGFESMNGHPRLILPQLIHNIRMRQLLPVKGKELARSATPLVSAFIESVTGTAHSSDRQCRTVEAKGRITHKQLNHDTASALMSASYISSSECYLHVGEFDITLLCTPPNTVKIECETDQFAFSSTNLSCS